MCAQIKLIWSCVQVRIFPCNYCHYFNLYSYIINDHLAFLAMKLDISKAFDTLDLSFLLKVLHQFGFNQKFCSWIESILESANLSVSINGAHNGSFKCQRLLKMC